MHTRFVSYKNILVIHVPIFVVQTSFVKIFPKVSHGWTVRYKPDDAEEVKAAEEAHQDLLNWFAKHLK